jgi:hypothetical protein
VGAKRSSWASGYFTFVEQVVEVLFERIRFGIGRLGFVDAHLLQGFWSGRRCLYRPFCWQWPARVQLRWVKNYFAAAWQFSSPAAGHNIM